MLRMTYLCLAVVLCAAAGRAQADFSALMTGKAAPLSLPAKTLAEGNWFQCKVGGQAAGTDMLLLLTSQGQLGMSGVIFYTQGATLTLAGESFLIAYQAPRIDVQAAMREGKPPAPAVLTPDTPLSLTLLNFRTCGNLLDIRPFDKADFNANPPPVAVNPAAPVEDNARLNALRNQSLQQVRQLATAMQMYVQDHDGRYPVLNDAATMQAALLPYLGNAEQLFLRPGTGEPYLPNPWLSERREAEVVNPTETIAVYEPAPWPDGRRGVGFADGHVVWVDEAKWQALKKHAGIP